MVDWENMIEEVNRTKYRNSRDTVLPIPFPWMVIMVCINCYLVKYIIPIAHILIFCAVLKIMIRTRYKTNLPLGLEKKNVVKQQE
jgi:hypothetical protein